jgi:hypothetical protein
MSTRLPTQLPAHVDNAPSSLKAARYPQADNCVDNRLPRLLHKNHDTPGFVSLRHKSA